MPRLMPSSGALAGRASSAARSSVPSPPSANTISAPSAASGPATGTTPGQVQVAGLVGDHPDREAGLDQVARRRYGRAAVLSGGPVWVTSSAVGSRRASASASLGRLSGHWRGSRPRRPAARPDAATGRTRRCPTARAAGWPPRRPRPGPSPAAAAATSSTASARSRGSRTTPPGADPVPAHLELRLHHRHQVAVGRGAGGQRRQHQPQRDERQVGHGQLDRAADLRPGSATARWSARARVTRESLRNAQASCP